MIEIFLSTVNYQSNEYSYVHNIFYAVLYVNISYGINQINGTLSNILRHRLIHLNVMVLFGSSQAVKMSLIFHNTEI